MRTNANASEGDSQLHLEREAEDGVDVAQEVQHARHLRLDLRVLRTKVNGGDIVSGDTRRMLRGNNATRANGAISNIWKTALDDTQKRKRSERSQDTLQRKKQQQRTQNSSAAHLVMATEDVRIVLLEPPHARQT